MAIEKDTIEKVHADMAALIQRAFDLGDKHAVERLFRLARADLETDAAPDTSTPRATPDQSHGTNGSAPPAQKFGRKNDPEYGAKVALIRRAIRDNAEGGGIFPSEIPEYCAARYGETITGRQVRNATRNLRRTRSIASSDNGKWLPGPGIGA